MSTMKREFSRIEQQAEQTLLLAKRRKTFALIESLDSRNHRPRLVSIVTQCGDVLYDPIRQPRLHAASQRELIRAQAERTNQVFRAAVEQRQPAPATRRFWLSRALAAVAMMWDVVGR